MGAPAFDVAVPHGGYAWWYLDALSDDGRHGLTIIAFVGSVFSPYYAHARHRLADGCADPLDHCAINVALYGDGARRWSMTERRSDAVGRTATRFTVGPSALEWKGTQLHLRIDERCAPLPMRVRGTIVVDADVRVRHDVPLDRAGRHVWSVVAPVARIAVALDAPSLRWRGTAYLDSNRGSRPLEADFVRWNWSRGHFADGRTAVCYDVERRDDTPLCIATTFDAHGNALAIEAPPEAALPASRWGLRRATRCDAGAGPSLRRSLEDGPFYARAVVDARWCGQPVTTVHEHLSLQRFDRRWVRAMLPFRMPRRF